MKKYDLRLDIPARAIINANIIQTVQKDTSFVEVVQKKLIEMSLILNQSELNSYHLTDQSFLASLLYCLIVVPKELMNLPKHDEVFQLLDNMAPSPTSLFILHTTPQKFTSAPSYWLIRLLRHSISHVLYEIDDENNWVFWTDRDNIWRASIKRDELCQFLSAVGRALANRVLKIKQGQLNS